MLTISISTPGLEGFARGIAGVGRVAMPDHLVDRFVIADHHAVVAPFIAKDLAQQERIAGRWNAVQGVEGGHEGGDTRGTRGIERRQVDFAEKDFGNPGAVVIAAGLRGAVTGEMLGAGSDGLGIGERGSLKAADHSRGKSGCQARVFARDSPRYGPTAGRGRYRASGAKVQWMPSAAGLAGGQARCLFHKFGVPCGGLSERNREGSSCNRGSHHDQKSGGFGGGFRSWRSAALRRGRPGCRR